MPVIIRHITDESESKYNSMGIENDPNDNHELKPLVKDPTDESPFERRIVITHDTATAQEAITPARRGCRRPIKYERAAPRSGASTTTDKRRSPFTIPPTI
jgi:hypothetical protein